MKMEAAFWSENWQTCCCTNCDNRVWGAEPARKESPSSSFLPSELGFTDSSAATNAQEGMKGDERRMIFPFLDATLGCIREGDPLLGSTLHYASLLLVRDADLFQQVCRQYLRFSLRFRDLQCSHEQQSAALEWRHERDVNALLDQIATATGGEVEGGVLVERTIQRHLEERRVMKLQNTSAEKSLEAQLRGYLLQYARDLAGSAFKEAEAEISRDLGTAWLWGEYVFHKNPTLLRTSSSTSFQCGVLRLALTLLDIPCVSFSVRRKSEESLGSGEGRKYSLHSQFPIVLNISPTSELPRCLGDARKVDTPHTTASPPTVTTKGGKEDVFQEVTDDAQGIHMRIVEAHLRCVCSEEMGVLLLIGSLDAANRLVDSVSCAELLVPDGSVRDEWRVIEFTGSGEASPTPSRSSARSSKEGVVLRLRTGSCFWAGQVVLLYSPPAGHWDEGSATCGLREAVRQTLQYADRWAAATISIALLSSQTVTLPAAVNGGGKGAHSSSPPPPIGSVEHRIGSVLRELTAAIRDGREALRRPKYGSTRFTPAAAYNGSAAPAIQAEAKSTADCYIHIFLPLPASSLQGCSPRASPANLGSKRTEQPKRATNSLFKTILGSPKLTSGAAGAPQGGGASGAKRYSSSAQLKRFLQEALDAEISVL